MRALLQLGVAFGVVILGVYAFLLVFAVAFGVFFGLQ